MDADREKNVAEIKDKIRQDTYRVDPKAVADAIIARMLAPTPVGVTVNADSRTAVRCGR